MCSAWRARGAGLGARLLWPAERCRRRPACGRRRDHATVEASHPRARAPRLPPAAGDHSTAPQSRPVSLPARRSRSAQPDSLMSAPRDGVGSGRAGAVSDRRSCARPLVAASGFPRAEPARPRDLASRRSGSLATARDGGDGFGSPGASEGGSLVVDSRATTRRDGVADGRTSGRASSAATGASRGWLVVSSPVASRATEGVSRPSRARHHSLRRGAGRSGALAGRRRVGAARGARLTFGGASSAATGVAARGGLVALVTCGARATEGVSDSRALVYSLRCGVGRTCRGPLAGRRGSASRAGRWLQNASRAPSFRAASLVHRPGAGSCSRRG